MAAATTKAEKREITVQYIRPEARELMEVAKSDISTRNGYGLVMTALQRMPEGMRILMTAALKVEGYEEIDHVIEILQIKIV